MNRFVGIVLVALSAAGFGTLAIFGRYAYADGMDALTVLLAAMLLGETPKPITLLGGGLILVAVLLLTHSELHHTEPELLSDEGS